MTLERDNRSLQARIKETLRSEIAAGVWRAGEKVPPEPELMRRFGVSRITVSQALRDLAVEGLLVRRRGKGTFVTSHPQGWTNLGALLQRMPLQRGGERLEHSLNLVDCTVPPADVAIDLMLAPEERTWSFTRVKQTKAGSAQWEQAYIPESWVTDPPSAGEDLSHLYFIEILERMTGQAARRCRAFMQAVTLSAAVAEAIGEVPGKPTIEVTRLWSNALSQPVLLTRSILRPDGTRYFVDLPELEERGTDQP